MRRGRVEIPRVVSHAPSGAWMAPVDLRMNRIRSSSRSSRDVIAPPSAVECPSLCLVVE